jgi:allantoin racemase
MRILVANSNTSKSHTEIIANAARASASPGTEIVPVTASFGPSYINSRTEATIAAHATLEALASHADGVDAGVIAAFVDPGLAGARESLPFPVVGVAEASMLTACMLGARFSIVTSGPRCVWMFREVVDSYGLGSRLASVHAIPDEGHDPVAQPDAAAAALAHVAQRAVAEDRADVILLGGAPFAALRDRIAAQLDVPILDSVSCGVRQAEVLVNLRIKKAAKGSYTVPVSLGAVGVPESLTRFFMKGPTWH